MTVAMPRAPVEHFPRMAELAADRAGGGDDAVIAHLLCDDDIPRAICGALMLRKPPVEAPPSVERCGECAALWGT